MQGEIHIGTGIVQVHDIFKPLPQFMRQADVIFSDPPYNKSALSSYYTKAGLSEKPDTFESFFYRFIECLDIISPWLICLEVGLAQTDMYVQALKDIGYSNIVIKESFYYGNKKQKCNIIFACAGTRTDFPEVLWDMPFFDDRLWAQN